MSWNGAGSRGLREELRECAAWLTSPGAYASTQIARQTGCGVLRGPFAGMRYPWSFVPRRLFPGPYVAGSFECELDSIIEAIIAAEPEVLVNVGAAQGYYAVGLGRAVWEMSVIAYEADPALRAAARRIARLNEVEPRLDARGTCTVDELAGLGQRLAGRRVCVLMDCEGAEAELIDPAAAPWLARASLLVELHGPDGASGQVLERRLAGSHELRLVRAEPRWASRFPELWSVAGLRQIDRELVVAEYRQGIQEWLWAVPDADGEARASG
jgi:hypothetical protein